MTKNDDDGLLGPQNGFYWYSALIRRTFIFLALFFITYCQRKPSYYRPSTYTKDVEINEIHFEVLEDYWEHFWTRLIFIPFYFTTSPPPPSFHENYLLSSIPTKVSQTWAVGSAWQQRIRYFRGGWSMVKIKL